MPLSLRENRDQHNKSGSSSGPILHEPKESMSRRSKMIGLTVAVVVVIIVAGILYKTEHLGNKRNASEQYLLRPVDTMKAAFEESSAVATPVERAQNGAVEQGAYKKQSLQQSDHKTSHINNTSVKKLQAQTTTGIEKKSAPRQLHTAQFTIYIGTYKSKSIAEQEAQRWNEAGYEAFVREFSGKASMLYRVCLGRYTTKNEARETAEKYKTAFENGYWVDVVK